MIITLKNADFSASNIGTLSTLSITRSLGVGANYNGPIYVENGSSLNAIITIDSEYELRSDGIIVTMGGATVTSGININDNIITISISQVIGAVNIKVYTQKVAGVEQVATLNKFNPNDPDTTYVQNKYITHNGDLSQLKESNYYYCTSGFIPCRAGDIIRAGRIDASTGLWKAVMTVPCTFYDANKNFISGLTKATDPNGGEDRQYVVPNNADIAYARVTFRQDFWNICMVTINQASVPTKFVEYGK